MSRPYGWYWIRFYKKSRWAPAEWLKHSKGYNHWWAEESPKMRGWSDDEIHEIGPQIIPPPTDPANNHIYLTFQNE